MKPQILLVLLTVLSGCQTVAPVFPNGSLTTRLTEIKLMQPLTVSPGTRRVFVQDGRVLSGGGDANQYRPQCAFEVRERMDLDQIIPPQSFRVARVQSLMEEVVQWKPVRMAGLLLRGINDGGAPQVHAGYHFWFDTNNGDVRRMTCYGVFADIYKVEPPTLEEIRQALAGIAELILEKNKDER